MQFLNSKRILAFVCLAVAGVSVVSYGTERESGSRRASLALEIVFSSPGNGIDQNTQDDILKLANEEVRSARLVALTVKPWGREGERNICLQFSNFMHVRSVEARIQDIVLRGNAASAFEKTSVKLISNCFESNL